MSIINLSVPNSYRLYFDALDTSSNCHIGGDLTIDGSIISTSDLSFKSIKLDASHNSTSISTGTFVVDGGCGISDDVNIGGNLKVFKNITCSEIIYQQEEVITGTDESTSISTGSQIILGGCGIYKNLNVGGNIQTYSTLNATDTHTGSLIVSGGMSVGSDLYIGGLIHGNLGAIYNTTESTSCDTGAIIIEGGVGIYKNVNIGGNLNAGSANLLTPITSTSTSTGTLTIAGGIGVGNNINAMGNIKACGSISAMSGIVRSTGESTSSSTGSLLINGGVGIAKSVFIGGDASVQGTLTSNNISLTTINITGTDDSTNTSTGSVIISGGIGLAKSLYVGDVFDVIGSTSLNSNLDVTGITSINNTINATSSSNGSLIIKGGVGIGKNMYVGGKSYILDSSNSTSSSNGSLIINGGVGVGKNMYVGGDENLTGTLEVTGATTLNSTLGVSGITTINNTINATNTLTGSLIIKGGVGIANALYIGGKSNVLDTTNAGSSSTGSLIINGGIGIAKSICVGNRIQLSYNTTTTRQYSAFTTLNLDYNYGTLSTIGTKVGTVNIAGGLALGPNGNMTYDLYDGGNTGTVKMMFKPSWSGALFSGDINVMYINKNTTANSINLVLQGSNFTITMRDSSNNILLNSASMGSWNPIGGVEYEFEIGWSTTLGNVMFFINGELIGSQTYTISTRSNGVTMSFVNSTGALHVVSDYILFPTKLHASSYSPGYGLTNPFWYSSIGNVLMSLNNTIIQGWTNTSSQIYSTLSSTNSVTGALVVYGGLGISGNNFYAGKSIFSNTTNTTSLTTGSINISGGVGIAKSLYVGDVVNILGTTSSTNSVTGSLIINGGVGISNNLHVGLLIHSNSLSLGNSSSSVYFNFMDTPVITWSTPFGNQNITTYYTRNGSVVTMHTSISGTSTAATTFSCSVSGTPYTPAYDQYFSTRIINDGAYDFGMTLVTSTTITVYANSSMTLFKNKGLCACYIDISYYAV